MTLLILNYEFLRPNRSAEKLMLKKTTQVINFINLIMKKGNNFNKQLMFKWLASICRDNFAFLIDMPQNFIDHLFKLYKMALKNEDWLVVSNLMDIFQILMFYRYKNIAANTNYICVELMNIINSHNSILNQILVTHLPETLQNLNFKADQKEMSFKGQAWKVFHSKQVEFYEMTSEKTPEFKTIHLDEKTIIGWKLLRILENICQLDKKEIFTLLKNNLSLQNLQRIKFSAGECYFIKQPCLRLIEKLYIGKIISENDLNFVTTFVVDDILKDIEAWRKREESGKNSDPIFVINNVLLNMEEQHIEDTQYRPYFEKIYFMMDHTFKEYIVKNCTKFIKALITLPKYSQNFDFGFLKQFKTQFKKVNMLITDDIQFVSKYDNPVNYVGSPRKKSPKKNRRKKGGAFDGFKGAVASSSSKIKSTSDILKDDVLSEANLTFNAHRRALWNYIFEDFMIHQKST